MTPSDEASEAQIAGSATPRPRAFAAD